LRPYRIRVRPKPGDRALRRKERHTRKRLCDNGVEVRMIRLQVAKISSQHQEQEEAGRIRGSAALPTPLFQMSGLQTLGG
jgi:hypothetical protein